MRIPLTKLNVWEGNVRKVYADEAVSELAASIAAHRLLKSLIVRKVEGGEYAVVDGGLRLRALQSLRHLRDWLARLGSCDSPNPDSRWPSVPPDPESSGLYGVVPDPMFTAIVFLGDQFPVSSQQCLGRDDRSDCCQHFPA
jgi:hypothetical protein